MHFGSLFIHHPDWSPDEVSEVVGVAASTAFPVSGSGEGRRGALWSQNYPQYADAPDAMTWLAQIIQDLVPRKEALQRLRESGGTIELNLCYTPRRNVEMNFTRERMAALSALGIDFKLHLSRTPSDQELEARFGSGGSAGEAQ